MARARSVLRPIAELPLEVLGLPFKASVAQNRQCAFHDPVEALDLVASRGQLIETFLGPCAAPRAQHLQDRILLVEALRATLWGDPEGGLASAHGERLTVNETVS